MDVLISEADISAIRLVKQANHPAAPAASSGLLYLLDTDTPYIKLDDNTTIDLLAGGGSPSPSVELIARRITDQSATDNVWTLLVFTSAPVDNVAWNEITSIFTVPETGRYIIEIYAHTPGGANRIGFQLQVNGSVRREQSQITTGTNPQHHTKTFTLALEEGDELSVYAVQISQSLFSGSAAYPMELQIWRL